MSGLAQQCEALRIENDALRAKIKERENELADMAEAEKLRAENAALKEKLQLLNEVPKTARYAAAKRARMSSVADTPPFAATRPKPRPGLSWCARCGVTMAPGTVRVWNNRTGMHDTVESSFCVVCRPGNVVLH